jgi:hypothetical protein
MAMTREDREALELAIETLRRADPDYRIDTMRKTQPWQQVALFAVRLRPWEAPPCVSSTGVPADRYGSRNNEIALLKRMLGAGISRFHPDPLGAIGVAEAKPAA